jgi:hypothetical protein
MSAIIEEPERYGLGNGYEAIFWKNRPLRRRSFDVLLPNPRIPKMTLAVSPADLHAMGFEKVTSSRVPVSSWAEMNGYLRPRRHSISGETEAQVRMPSHDDLVLQGTASTPWGMTLRFNPPTTLKTILRP